MAILRTQSGGTNPASGGDSIGAGSTMFYSVADSISGSSATEAVVMTTLRTDAIFRGMTVRVTVNSRTSSSTARFRKNGANGSQSLSIGAGLTGVFRDTANADSLAAGDTANMQITGGTGGAALRINQFHTLVDAANAAITYYRAGTNSTTSASSTGFVGLVVNNSSTSGEDQRQVKFLFDATLRGLEVYITSNSRTTTTTFKTRVNSSDGAQSASVGAGLTGKFQDTTNSDSVTADDLVNSAVVTGTGTEIISYAITVQAENPNDSKFHPAAGPNTSASAGATVNMMCIGRFSADATEANTQIEIEMDGTISNISCFVATNGVTATSTFKLRKNGGDGTGSVSIASTLTGYFEDSSGSDSVAAGDDLNFQMVAGGTGTTIAFAQGTSLFESTVTPAETDVTKAAAYAVATETDVTKAAAYAVLAPHEVTKALEYAMDLPEPAVFTQALTPSDASDFTGAASGSPAGGNVTLWYKPSGSGVIDSIAVRFGSSASDYTEVSFAPEADADWHFISMPLAEGSTTGTPDWTAVDFLEIEIAQLAAGSVKIDDIRLTADGSFTLYNVEESAEFDNARASFKKPTVLMKQLADAVGNYWYIDYEKDIHFFSREANDAPFSISDSSDNFEALTVDVDTTQLKNRQVVRGGTKTSESLYSQAVEGNGATREWIMKSQFVNLSILLDDGSSTDTMEATTSTTTVKATAHGLSTGDYVVNRTRSNAVRKVTVSDADTFTVEAVASQASSDTFSKFSAAQTAGVEFLDDEAGFDYLSNFNEKSIRSSVQTPTLEAGEFLLFTYNEIVPIRVQVSNHESIASMKSVVGGDGIFDGAVITDQSLDSTQAARDRAQAEINQFSNPIVRASFRTNHEGLESGQLLRISDTAKGISDTFLIQKVRIDYKTQDFPLFDVQCASTLFGIIEYFQKLSQGISERLIDEDEIIDQIVGEDAAVSVSESHATAAAHDADEAATITVGESHTDTERDISASPNKWEPDATDNRWNLAQWG